MFHQSYRTFEQGCRATQHFATNKGKVMLPFVTSQGTVMSLWFKDRPPSFWESWNQRLLWKDVGEIEGVTRNHIHNTAHTLTDTQSGIRILNLTSSTEIGRITRLKQKEKTAVQLVFKTCVLLCSVVSICSDLNNPDDLHVNNPDMRLFLRPRGYSHQMWPDMHSKTFVCDPNYRACVQCQLTPSTNHPPDTSTCCYLSRHTVSINCHAFLRCNVLTQ